jgi:hypothetical protein
VDDPIGLVGGHGHQSNQLPARSAHDDEPVSPLLDLHERTALVYACRMSASAMPCLNAESVTLTRQP